MVACMSNGAIAVAQGKKQGRPPASVEVAQVIEKNVSASVDMVGSVKALTMTVVSAEAPGRITDFSKKEGDEVSLGETVVALDETVYKIKVREALGSLDSARANLKKTELAARRTTELYRQKIASLENKQNADLDVDSAKANVKLREAELDLARYNLSRLRVTSPFSGFITRKFVDAGAWVEKGENLFEVVDTHKVEIIIEIPEHLMSAVNPSGEVSLMFDAYPGKDFTGEIVAVVPKANTNTRTFPVRIVMENPGYLARDGMFVRVKIPLEQKKKATLIPRDAIVWRERKALVFTVDENGTVRSIVVTLGRQYGELVEAGGDITPGQKLVVTGNEILRDGQQVMVIGRKAP